MPKLFKADEIKAVKEEKTLILYLKGDQDMTLPEDVSPSVSMDVLYGEEDDVPYLLLNIGVEDVEITAEIPYGEAWEVIRDGDYVVAVQPKGDDPKNWPMLVLGINDFMRGVVFGAGRLWEEISATYD